MIHFFSIWDAMPTHISIATMRRVSFIFFKLRVRSDTHMTSTWRPDIMLTIYYWHEIFLLTLRSDSDSDVRQWSHPLMIRLWTKLNNRTRGQVECDVTFCCVFLLLFDFVHSHARCSCWCTVFFFLFWSYANKTSWLQNEYLKIFLKENISWYFWTPAHKNLEPQKSR